MLKKMCVVLVAVMSLSACAVNNVEIKQDNELVAALRTANKADRNVTRAKALVKVTSAAMVSANATLVLAKQTQKQAHSDFEALYLASQSEQVAQ